MKISFIAVGAWLALAALQVSAAPQNSQSNQSSDGHKQDGKNLGPERKRSASPALACKVSASSRRPLAAVKGDSKGVSDDGTAVGKSGADMSKSTANVGVGAAKVATSVPKGFGKVTGALGKASSKLKKKGDDNDTQVTIRLSLASN